MCLRTMQNTAVTAENDIVCYKIVNRFDFTHTLKSVLYDFPYKIGEEYGENRFLARISPRNGVCTVEYGFHSYKNIEDAKSFLLHKRNVLLKCVIPKGTLYFEGRCDVECYCSQKIRVI